ncbi:MAG: hypothetical protein ACFN3C_05695 [Stomatobaculum longum]
MERETLLTERLRLARERLAEIPAERFATERFQGFFGREARALVTATEESGEARGRALCLMLPGNTEEEALLSVLSSVCSRAFSPQCDRALRVRCLELFLQCYGLFARDSAPGEIREAIYYDLFDYAEEDVRQRFSARAEGPFGLTVILPGELPWYADRYPEVAAAHAEDLSLFLDKALRDRLRPLIRETADKTVREKCLAAILRYQRVSGNDTRYSVRQQGWLRELYAPDSK